MASAQGRNARNRSDASPRAHSISSNASRSLARERSDTQEAKDLDVRPPGDIVGDALHPVHLLPESWRAAVTAPSDAPSGFSRSAETTPLEAQLALERGAFVECVGDGGLRGGPQGVRRIGTVRPSLERDVSMSEIAAPPPEGRIQVERCGALTLIGVDRPAKLNGFTPQMFEELSLAYHRFEDDSGARVAVLHAFGPAFQRRTPARSLRGAPSLSGRPSSTEGLVDPFQLRPPFRTQTLRRGDAGHLLHRRPASLCSRRTSSSRRRIAGSPNSK